jgi:filamentous hemagglutinin family protein
MRRQLLSAGVSALALLAAAGGAHAADLPTGGKVAAGSVSIQTGASQVQVNQTSDRAIVNWQSFDIGQGKSVAFSQPSQTSAILNRVTGQDVSQIAGTLSANGQVFLINPNGLIFSSTGKVLANGGFVGSTLDIRDSDFMAGRLNFSGSGGAILNQGHIISGRNAAVALLAGTVSNDGLIRAPLGKVMIGSGLQATLDLSGDGYLQVALPVDVLGDPSKALVSNAGRIEANGGQVVMRVATARDVVRAAVNTTGLISAKSLSGHDGSITLDGGDGGQSTVSGTLTVDGKIDGGRIDLTSGASLSLVGATLSATGGDQGGLIRVGGAFQGGQPKSTTALSIRDLYTMRFGPLPALAASDVVTFDSASLIDVTGGRSGGSAVLWSNLKTVQSGAIQADGGAVEVSSKGDLYTSLPRIQVGKTGTLLLDPTNITIDDTNASATTLAGSVAFADNSGNDDAFLTSDLMALVDSGANVVLQASNNITWTTSNVFDTASNPGSITLNAGDRVVLQGTFSFGRVALNIVSNDTAANGVDGSVRQSNLTGDVDLFSADVASTSDINLTVGTGAGDPNEKVGNIRLETFFANNLTMTTAGVTASKINLLEADPGDVTDTVTGTLTMTGALTVSVANSFWTINANSINWTDEATAQYSGFSGTTLALVQNGRIVGIGIETSGQTATKLALGAGGSSPQYTSVYGDAIPSTTQLHVVSGTVHAGDDITGFFASGSTAVSGLPAANSAVGNYTVTTSPDSPALLVIPNGSYFIDLRPVSETLQITPRPLTPTITNGAYTYGSPNPVVSLSGVVNSDTVAPVATLDSTTGVTLATNGSGYGFGAFTSAGSHNFTLTGVSNGNYQLASGTWTGTLAIAQKPLNYTIFDATSTYGTVATPGSVLSGVINSDDVSLVVSSTGLSVTAGVGTYPLTGGSLGGAQGGNYSIAGSGNTDATLTIGAKALTYVSTSATTTYGTLASVATPTLTGVINGDSLTVAPNLGGTALTATTPAGTYNIGAAISGAAAANYSIASTGDTAGVLTVNTKPVTFSVNNASQTYGSMSSVLTMNGLVSGDAVGFEATLDGNLVGLQGVTASTFGLGQFLAAGGHSFTFDGFDSGGSNYSLNLGSANRNGTLTVNQATLTYSIANTTATYGVTSNLPTVTLNGVFNSDQVSAPLLATNSHGQATTTDRTFMPADTYVMSASSTLQGLAAGNYVLASSGNTNGARTVSPATLFYTTIGGSSTYGTLASPGVVFDTVNGDSVTGSLGLLDFSSNPVALAAKTPAGGYAVVVNSIGGSGAGNYVLATSGNTLGLLTVNQKTLTYSFGAATSTYGTLANPLLTLTGVVSGDDVSGVTLVNATPLAANTSAGSYITAMTTLSGTTAGDYVLAGSGNHNGSLTISPKTITYSLANSTATYGDGVVYGAVTLNGLVGGDSTPSTTLSLAQTTSSSPDVGSYTEQAALTASSNYVLATSGNSQGTFSVTKRPVTISGIVLPFAGGGLTYGYKPSDLSTQASVSNTANGDVITGALTTPTLPVSTGGYIRVGTYTFPASSVLTGAKAGDYTVDVAGSVGGTLTINAKAITANTITVANNTYGLTMTVGSATFTGLLSGDTVLGQGVSLFSGSTPITAGPQTPAGSYTAVANGITGADAGNYTFSAGSGTTVAINPKTLTWSISQGNGVYGSNPTLGTATLIGLVGSDQVAGTVALNGVTLSNQMNVATYAQTVAGLTGAAAANYSVGGGTDAGLKITPKMLGFTLANQNITYGDDESNIPNLVQLTGVLSGDSVSMVLSLFPVSGPAVAAGNRTDAFTNLLGAVTINNGHGSFIPYVLPAATYTVAFNTLTGNSSFNYSFPTAQEATLTSLTVNQRPLTYTVTGGGSTVFGTVLAPSAVAFANTVAQTPTYHYVATNSSGSTQYDTGAAAAVFTPVGGYTLGVALNPDSYNYVLASAGNVTPALTITPKPITLNLKTISDTYGDSINDLVDTTGLVSGDTTAPTVKLNGATITLASTSSGFGLSFLLDAGAYAYSFQGLSGAGATNYTVTTAGTPTIAVAQKPVTFSVDPATLQYGGTTSPDTAPFCGGAGAGAQDCAYAIHPGALGNAALTGVLASDAANVSTKVQITDGTTVFDYAAQTPAGAYAEVVSSLTGTRASNYVLANTGNTAGLLTIQPAWLYATVTGGGRLLNGTTASGYQIVGDPGEVSFQHYVVSGVGGTLVSGLFPGDSVTGLVAVYSGGNPVVDATNLPVGDYQIQVVTLTGPSAANYRLAPVSGLVAGFGLYTGSTAGDLNIVDASLFNFSFLTNDPNNASYTPPAAVTRPPSLLSIGTGASAGVSGSATASTGIAGIDASATATGATSASASVGLTGGKATAGASGNASSTVSAGIASASVDADASTAALAKFGVTGVKVTADAQAGTSVTVAIGPVSQSYGANASASTTTSISLSQNPSITLTDIAMAGASTTTAVAGGLGNGVTGSVSTTGDVFAEARSTTTIGYSNGTLKIGENEFVGVGASTGVSGSVSGGGVTGSASVTVYSPGSLGLGAQSTSGISNGTVTIGFTLGISIGIGGLQISPSFSFQTAALTSAANTAATAMLNAFGVDTSMPDPCTGSPACFAIEDKNTAIAMLKANGPTMSLMTFLAQHPDAIQSASQLNGLPDNAALLKANSTYSAIPGQLTSVVQQEQVLAQKMQTNPASLTPADLQLAQSLRTQEATLVAETQTLGGKLQVANGQISLVSK